MKMVEYMLTPSPQRTRRAARFGGICLLTISAAALLAAPLLMPEGYTWIKHTTSESAAQGLNGAWLARFGFLAFGLGALWITSHKQPVWARGAVWMHAAFGVCMLATAAFSHQPWQADVPFDSLEDTLHSISATGMGFAFAFGVAARMGQELMQGNKVRWLHLVALLAATILPILMAAQPELPGLFQRIMFSVAYLWYGLEALGIDHPPPSP